MAIGTRAEVFHSTAEKTSGGLTKKDLMMGKDGRIKSKAAHAAALSIAALLAARASRTANNLRRLLVWAMQ